MGCIINRNHILAVAMHRSFHGIFNRCEMLSARHAFHSFPSAREEDRKAPSGVART